MKRRCLYRQGFGNGDVHVTVAEAGKSLSSAPARFYNSAAGQGIPDPDRGAHWARDTVCSSCVLFLVSLVIDLCCLTAVEERW